MLTPPPSPRPFSVPPPYSSQPQLKKAAGRRYTFWVLLLPLCLIVLTLASHYPHLINGWNSQTLFHNPLRSSHTTRSVDIIPLNRRQPSTTSAPILSNPFSQASATPSMSAPQSSPSATKNGLPVVPTISPDTPGILPTPFPQPFDVSLSSNFSSSQCQDFFLSFTQDTNFRRCRPISLLLGTSQQFNQAQSNTTLLTDVIWGTCNTVPTEADCQNTMNTLATTLQSECRSELSQDNLLVQQALTGFQMYTPMRDASCQVDQDTKSYCLVEAVAASSPADFYFYLLPYGNALPNGTVPSCSTCIKSVLSIYAQAVSGPSGSQQTSTTSNVPLDHTYPAAAQIAVQQCGSVYAQQVNTSGTSIGTTFDPLLLCASSLFSLVLLLL